MRTLALSETVGKTDSATVTFCNNVLSNEWEGLWRRTNWSESLYLVYTTVAAGPVIICPPIIDRVQAVRWDTNTQLSYCAPGQFFQLDPNVFDRTGSPTMFTRLGSCGVAIQPSGTTITVSAVSGSDLGQKIVVHGTYLGDEQYEEITMGAAPVTTVSLWDQIDQITKNTGTSIVSVTNPSAVVLVILQPWENEKRYQRIKILEQAVASKTVLVLGKRRTPPLTNDNDSPALRGADGVLILLLEAALYTRDHELTKAGEKMKEAELAIRGMIEEETEQEAFEARIIPVVEANFYQRYGSPYAFPQYTK